MFSLLSFAAWNYAKRSLCTARIQHCWGNGDFVWYRERGNKVTIYILLQCYGFHFIFIWVLVSYVCCVLRRPSLYPKNLILHIVLMHPFIAVRSFRHPKWGKPEIVSVSIEMCLLICQWHYPCMCHYLWELTVLTSSGECHKLKHNAAIRWNFRTLWNVFCCLNRFFFQEYLYSMDKNMQNHLRLTGKCLLIVFITPKKLKEQESKSTARQLV